MTEQHMTEPKKYDGKQVWLGILYCLLLHVAAAALIYGIISVADAETVTILLLMALGFIGVTQVLYITPAAIIAKKKGRTGIMQGLLIGAGITFLLNAACYGLVFSSHL